jgi:hypothetical protein
MSRSRLTSGELERLIARWRRRDHGNGNGRGDQPVALTANPAITSVEIIAEQIKHLRADVEELRGRVNGLLFTVIGAVLVQFVLRLLE